MSRSGYSLFAWLEQDSPERRSDLMLRCFPLSRPALVHAQPAAFFKDHCVACHDADSKKGDLDRMETNEFSSDKGTFRGLEMA
jgi:hypothetical protein